MYGKRGSKVAKNFRFEARQLLAQVPTILENLRIRRSKMELLIKNVYSAFYKNLFSSDQFRGILVIVIK